MEIRRLTDEEMVGYICCLTDRINQLTELRDMYEETLEVRKNFKD